MPSFEYWVKDKTGKDFKGVQDARDEQEIVRRLKALNYLIVRVEQVKRRSFLGVQTKAASKVHRGKSGNITLDDLVVFSRQMATLVAAGIPLVQALDILAGQMDKEKFRLILRRMHSDVQSGKSFSEAMLAHQKVFSMLFIHMTRAGEMSGKLQEILDRVAQYFEKSSALQKKVRAALMYPTAVAMMAFMITFFMLSFVIPKFAVIFEGLEAKLPMPTQILIMVSNYLAIHWWWILIILGGSIFLFRKLIHSPLGRMPWDAFTLRMPIFGPIILKVAISKFSRTLSTLVRSGVAILAALEIVSKTSGNALIEKIIMDLMGSVKRGESIAGPLEKSGIFPSMVVRMIAIGEETGELEEMLTKIADFYDTQVDTAVSGLTALIEPIIVAFLGIVIGGIVIALFLPIFTLVQAIK